MRSVKLLAAFAAFEGIILPAAPASAQSVTTAETTAYVYCSWSTIPGREVAISQIEEIRWRDEVYSIGSYVNELGRVFAKRLGLPSEAVCEWETSRTYDGREPGTSYKGWDGAMIAVVLHEVDQSWFTPELFDKNILAIGNKKPNLSSPTAKQASTVEKDLKKEAAPAGPTAVEIAAEKHRAVEERNRAAQEKYEAELAEQKRKVEEYQRAQEEVARKKAEQAAVAQAAIAAHDAQLAVAAEAQRKHEADLAKYEQEVTAQKLRKDFDERHKLGQASTDTDANQCVTTPETQLNASFQGNTAASVVNGCGQPVDVRICLMTDKGWNCGATYGLGSQQRWSHSSFNATGQVFSDARTSGSSRALATPN